MAIDYPLCEFTWGLKAPFIDPPDGGYPGDFADNLPYYWDEGTDARLSPDKVLGHWTEDYKLTFLDAPKHPLMFPWQRMKFMTCLVGVRKDKSYKILHSYLWSSNWSGNGGGISTRNPVVPSDTAGTTGGIIDVQENVPMEQVPSETIRLLVNNGAIDVPFVEVTPGALGLVVSWPTNLQAFVLQGSTNLLSGAWTDITTASNSYPVEADTPVQYFRLIKR